MVDIAKIPQTIGVAVGGSYEIFNVDIDASNFERGYMRWAGNVLEIGTEKGGTGVKRPARINASDVQIVTPGGHVASFLSPLAAQAGAIALTINGNGIATFSGNGIVLNDKPLGFNGGFGVAAPDIALRWLLGTYTTAIGVTDSTTNLRDFRCRMLMLPAVAVSQLQPATTSTGVAMVNDALAPVSGDPVVGGGTVTKLVYSDNTTWRVV